MKDVLRDLTKFIEIRQIIWKSHIHLSYVQNSYKCTTYTCKVNKHTLYINMYVICKINLKTQSLRVLTIKRHRQINKQAKPKYRPRFLKGGIFQRGTLPQKEESRFLHFRSKNITTPRTSFRPRGAYTKHFMTDHRYNNIAKQTNPSCASPLKYIAID